MNFPYISPSFNFISREKRDSVKEGRFFRDIRLEKFSCEDVLFQIFDILYRVLGLLQSIDGTKQENDNSEYEL